MPAMSSLSTANPAPVSRSSSAATSRGVAQREDRLVGGQVVENLARVYPPCGPWDGSARGCRLAASARTPRRAEPLRRRARRRSGAPECARSDGRRSVRSGTPPPAAPLRAAAPTRRETSGRGDRPIEMSDERHREAGLERGVVHLVEFRSRS